MAQPKILADIDTLYAENDTQDTNHLSKTEAESTYAKKTSVSSSNVTATASVD